MKTWKCYLSGPIAGLTYDESIKWTNIAKERLEPFGIFGYRPLRSKTKTDELKGVISSDPRNGILTTDASIYSRDRYDVESCDCMLVNLLDAKRVSIGTCYEMAWASLLRKPMIIMMEKEGNLHDHPFVRMSCDIRTYNLDDGIEAVKHILLP